MIALTATDSLLERLHLLPDELVELDQWVLWRSESRGGRPTKIPYRADAPATHAKSDDPATWSSFDTAVEAFADGLASTPPRFTGIGFVFSDHDRLVGMDFDDCMVGDKIDDRVLDAIDKLGGYAEVSPSGTGVKLWSRSEIPIPHGRTGFTRKNLWGCGQVEVYASRRYFTVTGRRIDR